MLAFDFQVIEGGGLSTCLLHWDLEALCLKHCSPGCQLLEACSLLYLSTHPVRRKEHQQRQHTQVAKEKEKLSVPGQILVSQAGGHLAPGGPARGILVWRLFRREQGLLLEGTEHQWAVVCI